MPTTTSRLADLMTGTPYLSYAYSYPHKTAYRPLPRPISLRDAWMNEPKDALFLYLHVPFCEMRCGFCNLFTVAHPEQDMEARYLDTLERQARRVAEAVQPEGIGRMAVGGGTPTFLTPDGLHRLFTIAERFFGAQPAHIPVSVETSPHTATPDRLAALRERGVDRVSIGVQSFVEAEVKGIGRGQKNDTVFAALYAIRKAEIPRLNIDLMYGLPGQTVETWLGSLQTALDYAPEELYLYPLYVRPLTGLDKSPKAWDDIRLACYRAGRDFLASHGYDQVSMRMFRRSASGRTGGPVYCCQEDGMLGLGCGARSYTSTLHYSSEYAVGRTGVRQILADYLTKSDRDFDSVDYGATLNLEEQRRRYTLKSLLQSEGLDLQAYRAYFGSDALSDLPDLFALLPNLARREGARLRLTDAGMERSDLIGPWLYSEASRRLMEEFDLK